MLWLKGWLETRFRLLFMLAFTALPLYSMHSAGAHASARSVSGLAAGLASHVIPFFIVFTCAFLAGAGIATQTPFQASKGLHGSTLFTLSMPVSRLRLLVVRAGIGWLETAAVIGILCCEMWLAMPLQRAGVTPIEMFEQAATLIACSSTVYFLAVLLGTVLDDQWRVWGTLLASAGMLAAVHTILAPCLCQYRSWHRGTLAHRCAHNPVECDGVFAWTVRNLILCGAEDCAETRILALEARKEPPRDVYCTEAHLMGV